MRRRMAIFAVGFAALAAGCTSAGGTPATAPPTSAPPPTTVTTTAPPTTTTTAPTTTIVDRLSEIQAIYEDLERRRIKALFSGDADAFAALFVDNPYKVESLRALEVIQPGEPPTLTIKVIEVLFDDPQCLVFVAETRGPTPDDPPLVDTTTLQSVDGVWKLAYVEEGRGDWFCTEPHPLSG